MDFQFSDLVGLTLDKVLYVPRHGKYDLLKFITTDGRQFHMEHLQDCCESCELVDFTPDMLDDLHGQVLSAEMSTNDTDPRHGEPQDCDDSYTWTFYRITTEGGSAVFRWFGSSNGYYSETCDFYENPKGVD